MAGTLYLCATPIGNLEDITLRVLKLMERVDVIAAEDTRNTLKLLNHFEIKTPMTSYHEHNKVTKGPVLVERLLAGESIALVTDAGMPGISDPGADLVKLCYAAGVPVTVAPGASAAVVALVLSGMDTRRFVFEGFLPPDKKERRAILKTLEREHRTMIFYEAPHRLTDTLAELAELFGESREVAAVRELTKKFEEVRRATIGEHLRYFSENPPKGEFVLVCEGFSLEAQRQAEREGWESISVEEHVAKYVAEGMSEKDAMKQAAKDRGVSKREIYQILKKYTIAAALADNGKEVFQMERLLAGFSALGWREYLFAAGMAYVLTYIYRVFQRRKESGKNKEKTYVIQTFDKRAIDRCKELFPIDVLSFKGKEFKRGMQIRITTIQQNVIVGEFIGLNRVNLVCIKTGNKIIAHQLEKIAEDTKAE